MKITLLGTGSPEPTKRRASSGYMVEVADETLLFDCGGALTHPCMWCAGWMDGMPVLLTLTSQVGAWLKMG